MQFGVCVMCVCVVYRVCPVWCVCVVYVCVIYVYVSCVCLCVVSVYNVCCVHVLETE